MADPAMVPNAQVAVVNAMQRACCSDVQISETMTFAVPRIPADNARAFSQLFSRLSRACLDKMIVCVEGNKKKRRRFFAQAPLVAPARKRVPSAHA